MSSTLVGGIQQQVHQWKAVRLAGFTWAASAMFILLVLALAYWLWLGMAWRSFLQDDGTSILAAQGVLEHGYPLLPSGFIYHRAYLPNYLMAGTSLVFGLNDFAVMLPSLLMSLGSLVIVYLFARDVMGRPWVGVAAAVLLLMLSAQASFATSPRMYMALQFFTLLASYTAWRGYVKGEGKYQWLTIAALLGVALSHEEAGASLVAITVSVLLVRWIKGSDRPGFNRLLALGGLAFLYVLCLIPLVYQLPGTAPQIAAHGGLELDRTGWGFDAVLWLRHALMLESLMPLGAVLAPLIAFLALKSVKRHHVAAHQGVIYTLLVFGFSSLALLMMLKAPATRFWLFIAPIYALLICASIGAAVDWVRAKDSYPTIHFWPIGKLSILSAVLMAWTTIIFLVVYLIYSPGNYLALAREGYGLPCSQGECSKTIKSQYASLRLSIKNDDIIISSNPWLTNYYLGRVDGFLRERIIPAGYTQFESPTDEYFGIPLVDSREELRQLRESEQRVWIIVDYKAQVFSSPESLELIKRTYVKYQEGALLSAYVSSSP